MNNFYLEGSKLPFNGAIDADICKLRALKKVVKESDEFTGRLEYDYIEGLDHCIELLDFMRVCELFLINKDGPDHYRPIKNTSKDFCYLLLYNLQQMYWRLFKI